MGWIKYYRDFIGTDFKSITNIISGVNIAGAFIVSNDTYAYAISHGQTHFYIRDFCDKDFGLDLAERIISKDGLKIKHSQTFTSQGRKDITSFTSQRNIDNSFDYGEAFNYVKCKTISAKKWGETADFGESVRFSFKDDKNFPPKEMFNLFMKIEAELKKDPIEKLPRYSKVTDKDVILKLNEEFNEKYNEFAMNVEVDDYWLTGVSFNFSQDYRYALKFGRNIISEVSDTLNSDFIKNTILEKAAQIQGKYDNISVVYYDENDDVKFSKPLKQLMQITISLESKYYVLYHNDWVVFNDSYVKYIEDQVNEIEMIKEPFTVADEDELVRQMSETGNFQALHKQNVYIGKYCIEKADLMNNKTVVIIKSQKNYEQTDMVYSIKQATTAMRLSNAGDLKENVFSGREVCIWLLITRKSLNKLSDFRSFHLLDALNDFKREAINMDLKPVIWITHKK